MAFVGYLGVALFVIPRVVKDIDTRGRIETYFFFASLCLLTYICFTARRRYMERNIYPKLSKALRPLRPNEAEIKYLMLQLRQQKITIAKALKPKELMRWVAQSM